MKLIVLGSGAWEGIPASFCSCAVCALAKKEHHSKNNRKRPQFLIENGGQGFLLEAGPDIRLQSTSTVLPPITDFVISHWHFDHMYGLHELLSWMKKLPQKPTVHCSPGTNEVIEKEFNYLPLRMNIVRPFQQFVLAGITITPLPVYHMFTRDNDVPDSALENTYGYLFETGRARVAYLGDYYRVPESTLGKIRGVDAVIADGTYLLTDKYKALKPNHLHGEDILSFTDSLGARIIYYHSVSHLTGKTHEEMQNALPPSHILTYDGMEINL